MKTFEDFVSEGKGISSTFKFNTLAKARAFRDRATKAMVIMLGDDKLFWVVTPADADRLAKTGYSFVDDAEG
jgi:hypothetical protein